MSYGIRALFETSKSVLADDITSAVTWTASDSFSNPVRLLLLANLTDATLEVSFDGVNPHFPIQANTQMVLDLSSDQVQDRGLWLAAGSKVYLRRIDTPTAGAYVYIGGAYGKGD